MNTELCTILINDEFNQAIPLLKLMYITHYRSHLYTMALLKLDHYLHLITHCSTIETDM